MLDLKNSFKIVTATKSFVVFASTPELKRIWMEHLQTTLDNIKAKEEGLCYALLCHCCLLLIAIIIDVSFIDCYCYFYCFWLLLLCVIVTVVIVVEWRYRSKPTLTTSDASNHNNGDNNTANTNAGELAPVWVNDKEFSNCMLCRSHFTVIHRRHHCRR